MVTRNKEVSGKQPFYQLIQEVSTSLVGAQTEEIGMLVDDCLAKIGEYFQVSQVGLGQWSKAGKILPSLRAWGPRPVSVYLERRAEDEVKRLRNLEQTVATIAARFAHMTLNYGYRLKNMSA